MLLVSEPRPTGSGGSGVARVMRRPAPFGRGSDVILVDQVADFFLEAAEDACLGLADCHLGHAEGG